MGSKYRKNGACSSAKTIALASLLVAVAGCAPRAAQPQAATADDASGAMARVAPHDVVESRHVAEPRAFAAGATAGSFARSAARLNGGPLGQPVGRDSEPQPPIPPICTLCP